MRGSRKCEEREERDDERQRSNEEVAGNVEDKERARDEDGKERERTLEDKKGNEKRKRWRKNGGEGGVG